MSHGAESMFPLTSASARGGDSGIPLAEEIATDASEVGESNADVGLAPDADWPTLATLAGLTYPPEYALASEQKYASKPRYYHFCQVDLEEGCYRITFTPNAGFHAFRGTMRVEKSGASKVVSGDLYRFSTLRLPWVPRNKLKALLSEHIESDAPIAGAEELESGALTHVLKKHGIPVYPRANYYSYLKVKRISIPLISKGCCKVTLSAEEYVYTHPPAGSFDGTFPAAPGSRTVSIVLELKPTPFGYTGSYFEGTLYEGGVAKGSFVMGRVSSYFRRAALEIDTVAGATAPPSAVGSESFRSVFETAGWDLSVSFDQGCVAVPPGVIATNPWSSTDLHGLMLANRKASTNLDAEWRMHLLVVPSRLGSGRGVMYDVIGVPREGVATFSDDGYPSSDSSNFGTATNLLQKQVARAFLRSASHEVGHGFNQIHQEQEGGADNSIMTTSPSVADVLAGAATGEPGVFPDDIHLGFNAHVRRHLIHSPDPAIRPGGMTFGHSHATSVPEADREWYDADELDLDIQLESTQIDLGEPLRLRYELVNRSERVLPVPVDIRVEAYHTQIAVTDPSGVTRAVPSYVVYGDQGGLVGLEPGQGRSGSACVFWSSKGFAFSTPGRHRVELRIGWNHAGLNVGVRAAVDVWVNYPTTQLQNDAAATLLHDEVGLFVALGGGAHLQGAVERIRRVLSVESEQKRLAAAFRGLSGLD